MGVYHLSQQPDVWLDLLPERIEYYKVHDLLCH